MLKNLDKQNHLIFWCCRLYPLNWVLNMLSIRLDFIQESPDFSDRNIRNTFCSSSQVGACSDTVGITTKCSVPSCCASFSHSSIFYFHKHCLCWFVQLKMVCVCVYVTERTYIGVCVRQRNWFLALDLYCCCRALTQYSKQLGQEVFGQWKISLSFCP